MKQELRRVVDELREIAEVLNSGVIVAIQPGSQKAVNIQNALRDYLGPAAPSPEQGKEGR